MINGTQASKTVFRVFRPTDTLVYWYPLRGLNPNFQLERLVSWPIRRRGHIYIPVLLATVGKTLSGFAPISRFI